MSSSFHRFKPLYPTSIIKDTPQERSPDLDIQSRIKIDHVANQKFTSSQKDIVDCLLHKLVIMQERQKQNQNRFLDCIKILQLQLASKDKINDSLKEQIIIVREELNQLKSVLNQLPEIYPNLAQIMTKRKTKLKKSLKSPEKTNPLRIKSPKTVEKQNLSPYMIETISSSRNSEKPSRVQPKTHQSNHENDSKQPFKLQSFLKSTKSTNADEYYHHHMQSRIQGKRQQQQTKEINFRLKNSPCSRKIKSKSIGGILKAKIFLK